MATVIKRNGYGQVEPNHLAMQQTGQIYAQLPAASTITQLENGQFAKYDYEAGKVNFTGKGQWLMVYNEEKLYGDTYNETHKDYAMKASSFTEEEMVPRLVETYVGDIYTTNCIGAAGSYRTEYAGISLAVGDVLTVNATGFLVKKTSGQETTIEWLVVKETTMPDGQPAVKLQRIK